jgi:hypothetical protein
MVLRKIRLRVVVIQGDAMMQEHHAFEIDQDNPFSRRELVYSLGAAMAWVALSAALVILIPARHL